MERGGHTYIMTNKNNTVLYTGVSSRLRDRVYEHKTGKYKKSYTHRYNCHKLVYYEGFVSIVEAIAREKQIKAGSRKKKEDLINEMNPEWLDLYDQTLDL
ncbi:MAG: GIY-YIG nuclease family protein [Chlorobi bacterium]|nr:GIY-YIG nuclease family protein [Chlorobiota bacterium]